MTFLAGFIVGCVVTGVVLTLAYRATNQELREDVARATKTLHDSEQKLRAAEAAIKPR